MFSHHDHIWRDFPTLSVGALLISAPPAPGRAAELVERHLHQARRRLADAPEGQFPEIQAWRRAFTAMGLKATRYRCASESLLRRLRRDGDLPSVHPLVDVCNAVSAATAIPVAALDLARIDGDLEVRYATGDENYLTFGGEHEHPASGEVTFADGKGNAHARRWTNRQSGLSAVTARTTAALIVTEALHDTAATDIATVTAELAGALGATRVSVLTRHAPGFPI
jgi:DNA/RNA-binding domain of Phe-tRNA-synthetase-like protein